MNSKLRVVLTELKSHFRKIYGDRLIQMRLYGSQARGEATANSDIDVLVILAEPVNPGEEITRTEKIVADLSLEYEEVISCLFIDQNHFRSRNGPLMRNIRREGILM